MGYVSGSTVVWREDGVQSSVNLPTTPGRRAREHRTRNPVAALIPDDSTNDNEELMFWEDEFDLGID
jgi:hypothetical protein